MQAWWNAGNTGQGVDVALIGTGVASVPALSGANKIVNGPDLSLESQNPSTEYLDTNGHGMFTAGTKAGLTIELGRLVLHQALEASRSSRAGSSSG